MNKQMQDILSRIIEVVDEIEKRTRQYKHELYTDTPIQKKIRELKDDIKKINL